MSTDQEKDPKAIAQEILKRSRGVDHEKVVGTARFLLLMIGSLNLLSGLYMYQMGLSIVMYVLLAQGLVFFLLYYFSKQYTLACLIIGLVIYTIPQILLFVASAISFELNFIMLIRLGVIIMLSWGVISVNKIPKEVRVNDTDVIDDL